MNLSGDVQRAFAISTRLRVAFTYARLKLGLRDIPKLVAGVGDGKINSGRIATMCHQNIAQFRTAHRRIENRFIRIGHTLGQPIHQIPKGFQHPADSQLLQVSAVRLRSCNNRIQSTLRHQTLYAQAMGQSCPFGPKSYNPRLMPRIGYIPFQQMLRRTAAERDQLRRCIGLNHSYPHTRQSGFTTHHPRMQQQRMRHQKRSHA